MCSSDLLITGRKRYPVIVMDSIDQAYPMLEAIKAELQFNPRLLMDFPDACGQGRVWQAGTIVTKGDVKVQVAGSGKKLRGLRHGRVEQPGAIQMAGQAVALRQRRGLLRLKISWLAVFLQAQQNSQAKENAGDCRRMPLHSFTPLSRHQRPRMNHRVGEGCD